MKNTYSLDFLGIPGISSKKISSHSVITQALISLALPKRVTKLFSVCIFSQICWPFYRIILIVSMQKLVRGKNLLKFRITFLCPFALL